jgi:photosystem II stability/assembly factor-like uncharacterized protein
MKNDAPKPLRIVLLDSAGKSIVGKNCTWETCDHGAAGFRVKGRQTVLRWEDEGKTWKRAEESR